MAWWDKVARRGKTVARDVVAREPELRNRMDVVRIFGGGGGSGTSAPAPAPNRARPLAPAPARPQWATQPVEKAPPRFVEKLPPRPEPRPPARAVFGRQSNRVIHDEPPAGMSWPAIVQGRANGRIAQPSTGEQISYPASLQQKATARANPEEPDRRVEEERADQQSSFQRQWALANTRELSQEDYAALSDRQKAAVEFNTRLVGAVRSDTEAGSTENTRSFLTSQDIVSDDKALEEFLSLDRAIGTSILSKLDDKGTSLLSTEALRAARGTGAPEAQRFANARSDSDRMSELLAGRLGTTGQTAGGDTLRPGFGAGPRDVVIQQTYYNMINSEFDLGPDDIAQGLAMFNEEAGTDVSPQEVWDFAAANVQAAQFDKAGNNSGRIPAPELDPITGAAIVPLDIAEIRRRYGL